MADPKSPAAAKSSANNMSFDGLPAAGKVGLGVMICAAIGGIYYFALHTEVTESLAQARSRSNELATQMNDARQRQHEYLALSEELASREGLDRANLRVLPEDPEIPAFLADLHRLAEMSGLEMRLVQPQPEETSEHYVEVPVELHFAGRYHQLARFFHHVSRLERAISMENVHLGTPTVVGEDVVLSVEVMATTYRRPSVEGDAAAAGGKP